MAKHSHAEVTVIREASRPGLPLADPALVPVRLSALLDAKRASAPRSAPADVYLAFTSVAADVEHCHARGIIHRDIKPSNIIVTKTGELRLIDFDVAARRGARSAWEGWEDVRIGTLPYSAPEQILDPATATYETADIYSLGVVLYEMLTGRIPFPMTDDEDEEEYRARLPFEEPVLPTAYRPDLAPEIEAVLLKAMRRDPAARHQSVAELRVELDAAFRAHTAGAPAAHSPRIIHHLFTLLLMVVAGTWLFLSF